MYISASFIQFAICAFLVIAMSADRVHKNHFRHEAVEGKCQIKSIAIQAKPTTSNSFYTIITPSLGAAPVKVTKQSQAVATFVPLMTMCVGPPVAFVPITNVGPPYLNYSMSVAGNGSCSTYYTRTVMTVYATTLTGLATRIKVSQCSQEVTFSSDFGYSLETPSLVMNSNALIAPAPAIK